MTQLLEMMARFFDENDWPYKQIDEESTIQATYRGDNGEWSCYALAGMDDQRLAFYSVYPINAPEEKLMKVAEFITRVNYALIIGNFELDFEDGEIRFKTSIDINSDALRMDTVARLVATNLAMADIYLPGFMKVIYGDISPAEAIAEIEEAEDIEESSIDSR